MITLSKAIDRFLATKKASGRAATTLKWYQGLLAMLDAHFGDIALDAVTEDAMIDYIVDCRERMTPDAADSYVRAFKSFWSWSSKRYSVTDPMQSIDYPKARRTPVEPMSIQTFKGLYNVAGNRDRALLLMLLSTGARIGELLQMKVSELDPVNRRHRVKGKGAKWRYLSWDERTQEHLIVWLRQRPDNKDTNAQSDYIWVSQRTGQVLTRNGVYQALNYLRIRADINERVHPHAIRHLSATLKAQSGMGTEVLRRKLGHENTKTTQRYMQINDSELDNADRKHNPLDYSECDIEFEPDHFDWNASNYQLDNILVDE